MTAFLRMLKLPVLLLWGLQDKITPPEVALKFHDLLPNATVKFVDQCGHLPMVERPDDYVRHVLSFLDGQRCYRADAESGCSS